MQTNGAIPGNLRPPGGLRQMLHARRDPLDFVIQLSRRPEPLSEIRLGNFHGYLVHDPQAIQHILQKNHHNYSKENLTYGMLRPVIGNGLVTSSGDEWLQQRRQVQPAFHARSQQSLVEITCRHVEDLLQKWDAASRQRTVMDLWSEMTGLTLRIICEALFGADIQGREEKVQSSFSFLNDDASARLRMLIPLPHWLPTIRNVRFRRELRSLEKIVYGIITQRVESGVRGHDLLDHLLTAHDGSGEENTDSEYLRDQVMTMLLAGHETTATLLTWTFYLLDQNPAACAHVNEEIRQRLPGGDPGKEQLQSLSYTQRVIEESLRIYPPIWVISRTARAADNLSGEDIPAGSTLVISPYATHRNPAFWQQPDRFNPDRFLPANMKDRHAFAYIPFGAGPRICIGRDMAVLEAKIILTSILRRFSLRWLDRSSVRPQPLITLRPDRNPEFVPERLDG